MPLHLPRTRHPHHAGAQCHADAKHNRIDDIAGEHGGGVVQPYAGGVGGEHFAQQGGERQRDGDQQQGIRDGAGRSMQEVLSII